VYGDVAYCVSRRCAGCRKFGRAPTRAVQISFVHYNNNIHQLLNAHNIILLLHYMATVAHTQALCRPHNNHIMSARSLRLFFFNIDPVVSERCYIVCSRNLLYFVVIRQEFHIIICYINIVKFNTYVVNFVRFS